jgi:hypothetical protein
MRYEISEVDVWSLARIVALVYAVMGLFAWLFLPLMFVFRLTGIEGAPWGWGFVVLFMILVPVINGITGFLVGLVVAVVYNATARSIGGLGIRLEARSPLDEPLG